MAFEVEGGAGTTRFDGDGKIKDVSKVAMARACTSTVHVVNVVPAATTPQITHLRSIFAFEADGLNRVKGGSHDGKDSLAHWPRSQHVASDCYGSSLPGSIELLDWRPNLVSNCGTLYNRQLAKRVESYSGELRGLFLLGLFPCSPVGSLFGFFGGLLGRLLGSLLGVLWVRSLVRIALGFLLLGFLRRRVE